MNRFVIIVASLFVTGIASAATGVAQLSWTRPTVYTDGSPLPVASISDYQIQCEFTSTGSTTAQPCASATPIVFAGSAVAGTQTFTFPAQGGRACWTLRTRVGVAVSDPASPPACRDFEPLKPNSPTNVTVTVTVSVGP